MSLNFKEPHVIRATYRIVTPMFIGGADPKVANSIRPPSFKGALRFWWRALNLGRNTTVAGESADVALRKLNEVESVIFGSALENDKGGQGDFLLSIDKNDPEFLSEGSPHPEFYKDQYKAARYLGYGLMGAFGKKAGLLERGCINEGQLFTVKLVFKKAVDPTVIEALKALGLLGGLGSRVRRGMGSLSLERLTDNGVEVWTKPDSKQAYVEAVKELFSNLELSEAIPVFTAISKQTRLDILSVKRSPYEVLQEYGNAMQHYRSWGYDATVLGLPSEKNFKLDHDWSKDQSNSSLPKQFHPKRIVFGLPQNYSQTLAVVAETDSQNSVGERRASPLLFHVQALSDTSFIGVSLLIKSSFLPSGVGIQAGRDLVPENIDWKVLTDFLDGSDTKGHKRFPNSINISEEVVS